MANRRSGAGLDYYELRRKHQEYKEKLRAEDAFETDAQDEPDAYDRADEGEARGALHAVDFEDEPEYHDDARYEEAGEYEDDSAYADEEGSNPFQSFISAFHAIREKLASMRAGREHPVLDDSDDEYEVGEPVEEQRAPFRFLRRHDEPAQDDAPAFEDESDAQDALDFAEDIPEPEDVPELADVPELVDIPEVADIPEEEDAPAFTDAPAESFDFDDSAFDEDDDDGAPRGGGLKRFISLFVVKDEPPAAQVALEPEVTDPQTEPEYDDSLFIKPREYRQNEEEHESMDDRDMLTTDMTEKMAEGMGEQTLSRRERRLLKEQAIAREQAAAEVAPALDASVDEPTRAYTPVARPQPEPEETAPSFFDEEEPVARKKSRRDYDDEDDDFDEPKPRKKSRRDYEDEDDDFEEPKPRKKSRRDAYDDDDYDDEDDDVAPRGRRASRKYDEYDDDYDDDDYDDDYDDSPSFGHYVLGVLKALIAVVLVVAVVLFGLYFADHAIDGGVGAYRWLREKAPFVDRLLPPGDVETDQPAEGDVDSDVDAEDAPGFGDEAGGGDAELDWDTPENDDAGTDTVG